MSEIYLYVCLADTKNQYVAKPGFVNVDSDGAARDVAIAGILKDAPANDGWTLRRAGVNDVTERVIDMVKNDPDLRARFLDALKPAAFADWDNAPKWANWYAVDASGCGYYYEQVPYRAPGNIWISIDGRAISAGISDNLADWRETLERRP